MPTETYWDANEKRYVTRQTISGGKVADDIATAAHGSTAGRGLGLAGNPGRSPMPKQSDFPGDTRGFATAMRTWRTEQDQTPQMQAQKKALADMAKDE